MKGGELPMIDDFFDDMPDFYIGAGIGFIEEELEEERKRRKRELDPDYDPMEDEEEPYP
jgi:hypothetical protein